MKDIIKFAIQNEIEAYDFYEDAANKVQDAGLKETFKELAEEEREHKKFLEKFLEGELDKMEFDNTDDYHISETVDDVALSTEMSFAEAITMAMKKEEKAMHLYQKLSSVSSDAEQKELFNGLAEMEKMHKVRLEKIYTNAAYVEVW